MSTPLTESACNLRRRAEEKLALSGAINLEMPTLDETRRLLHEMQVQRIELEMQNEELRNAIADRDEKESLLRTYLDLYDSAPVSFFVLNHAGVIHTVNLTGGVFLGVERSLLINIRLDTFISDAMRPAFYDFLDKVFTGGSKETFETFFVTEHHSPRYVQIEAVVNDSGKNCLAVIIDITERKKSEEKLAEASSRLEALMAAVPVGISFSDDITCRHITGNPAVLEQFKISSEDNLSASAPDPDAPGRKVKFFLDGREISDAELPMQRAVSENRVIPPMVLKVLMSGGNYWFAEASGAPVRDAQGNVIGGIAVTEDITARKQAEEALRLQSEAALRLSEEEFCSLAEAMPQIVWATRPDGRNIYFNQQWVDYTGMTMEESYGHGWNVPFHADDRQRAWDAWQRATQHNERYSLECRLRRADGVYRWWLIRGEPMRGANGEILKWFGTCTDIEELKRAEALLHEANDLLERRVAERTAELIESEQQFRVLIENLQSAVALLNESGEFTIVNRSFLQMFGLDNNSNIRNINDHDWSRWQVFDEYGSLLDVDEHPVRKAALTCRPVSNKLVAVKVPENPKLKWLLVSAEPILDVRGQIHRLICTYHDFTERKHAEDALRKLNEDLENKVMQRTAELREKDRILLMQSRQAAMGEMIGNISHQWRQPLNILGLQLQQLQLFYDLGEFNKGLLEKNIAGSMGIIQHMSKTIDDFRNYFKPDKEKSEFKVRESINSSLSLMEGNLKNPLIDVEVIATDDPVIYGYQNEFAQVILNIMNNARDVFIERDVSEPKVRIKICREDSCVVVTVADNAGGIPEDIIEKVFDPYFTTKGPQLGTGVGLFMSKSIIEKNMGGRITVQNIAEGAEFRIEF